MEIARLEVSTQNDLDRMQETAKVNYVQYGKSTKHKKGKRSQHSTPSTGSDRGSRDYGTQPRLSGKGRKIPLPPGTCYRCSKKIRNAKLWKLSVEVATKRGTLKRSKC